MGNRRNDRQEGKTLWQVPGRGRQRDPVRWRVAKDEIAACKVAGVRQVENARVVVRRAARALVYVQARVVCSIRRKHYLLEIVRVRARHAGPRVG
jgi:hypothetical protein